MNISTRALAGGLGPKRILVFRIGQLGDMIVALPALWAVRRYWPDAKLTLLCDAAPGRSHVLGSDVLGPTGLFDGVEHYAAPSEGGRLRLFARRLGLILRLRALRFDALIYLAPSLRKPEQVRRDIAFFRAAGIDRIYGAAHFPPVPVKAPGQPLAEGPPEADLLLARLAADGIPVASPGEGSLDLALGDAEAAAVARWRATLGADGGRTWIGVGPGSKMPAKRWPLQRFGEVVDRLIARYDIWPVALGGPEDRHDGDVLLARWGRGHNAAGALSVRESSMALRSCALFVGNDTGTMHLAAAAGTPCVAIFSARDWPGAWYPYGVARRVFRVPLDCEGCYLVECADRRNECLTRITVDAVVAGCEELLGELAGAASPLAMAGNGRLR
ncbi:MAG: glycosyltransferase family 9 protein [Methylocystis sp.]